MYHEAMRNRRPEIGSLLFITGMAFALLGLTLDRILNPRLREQ